MSDDIVKLEPYPGCTQRHDSGGWVEVPGGLHCQHLDISVICVTLCLESHIKAEHRARMVVAGVKYWEDCSVSIWVKGHKEEGVEGGSKNNRSDCNKNLISLLLLFP